jgi:hypothetical protein
MMGGRGGEPEEDRSCCHPGESHRSTRAMAPLCCSTMPALLLSHDVRNKKRLMQHEGCGLRQHMWRCAGLERDEAAPLDCCFCPPNSGERCTRQHIIMCVVWNYFPCRSVGVLSTANCRVRRILCPILVSESVQRRRLVPIICVL